MLTAARGMAAMHAKEYVHSDIKIANILLQPVNRGVGKAPYAVAKVGEGTALTLRNGKRCAICNVLITPEPPLILLLILLSPHYHHHYHYYLVVT